VPGRELSCTVPEKFGSTMPEPSAAETMTEKIWNAGVLATVSIIRCVAAD
jgi:hypothetical protein